MAFLKGASGISTLFKTILILYSVSSVQANATLPVQYIRAHNQSIIQPQAVLSNYTTGNVTNPSGFLNRGITTLSRPTNSSITPSITIDFGQNIVGSLSISFSAASFNTPGVRVAFSETIEYLSSVSDFSRSYNGQSITPGSDQIAVHGNGSYVWTNSYGCQHGNKVCSDGLHGFRYVTISLDVLVSDAPYTSNYGYVSFNDISVEFSAFLGTPDTFTGWFDCSDADLTQYWYDAAYTNDMCIDTFRASDCDPRNAASSSLIGKKVIHDGAKRDRDPYVGDVAVAGRSIYLTHDESIAARNVLVDIAIHQRSDGWLPPASINNYGLQLFDYPLWWIISVYDYMMYTGDSEFLSTYFTVIIDVLDNFYGSKMDTETGLLVKPDGYGDYAFIPRSGIVTYYNVLLVLALQNAATLAVSIDESEYSSHWSQLAEELSVQINIHLWDSSVGAYYDSINSRSHAQDGNSIAILAGVASSSRASSILSYWSKHALPYGNPFYDNDSLSVDFSVRVYAFISYFEISARFMSGMGDSAVEEIKRLYGWMSRHDPKITMWEGIGRGGSMYEDGFTSAAHGWSTGVLPALSNYVLGVQPTSSGFSTFSVKPMPVGGVTWARGQVATPHGAIYVDWSTDVSDVSIQIQVSVPPSTEVQVFVQVESESFQVLVDEEVVWDGSSSRGRYSAAYSDGYVRVQLSSGSYTLSAVA